jgi:hypothetical protein
VDSASIELGAVCRTNEREKRTPLLLHKFIRYTLCAIPGKKPDKITIHEAAMALPPEALSSRGAQSINGPVKDLVL